MKIPNDFIMWIETHCDVEEISGRIYCKKCGHRVFIDWFEKELQCSSCDEL